MASLRPIPTAILVSMFLALFYWKQVPALSETEVNAKLTTVDLDPYTPSEYPKLHAEIGSMMNEVTIARAEGARAAAQLPQCDHVEISDYSDRSEGNEIAVFVDCRNGFRIWYRSGKIIETLQN